MKWIGFIEEGDFTNRRVNKDWDKINVKEYNNNWEDDICKTNTLHIVTNQKSKVLIPIQQKEELM